MRILVIMEPVTVGAGAYNHWIELAKRLRSQGHVVRLSSEQDGPANQSSNLRINPKELIKFRRRLKGLSKSFTPDLVVTTISQSDIAYWLFRRSLKLSKLKWVVVALGVPYPVESLKVSGIKKFVWRRLWMLAANSADSVGAIGSNLVAKLRMDGLKISPALLFPVIDFERVSISPVRSDGMTISFIGRLSEEKNPEFFCELQNYFPTRQFVVAGAGPQADALKTNFPKVRFMGQLPSATVWMEVDKVFLTSRTEGVPLTLLEASIRRVPFLAAAVGSIADLVHPENRDLILLKGEETHDFASWSQRFENIETQGNWAEIVQRQFDHVFEKFEPTKLTLDFIQFLTKSESDSV